MDPRGFPTSLPEFQKAFPTDEACAKYLETLRWPGGFACFKCGAVAEPYRFGTRSSVVLRCRSCKGNTSLTAGTVMHGSHTALSTWFWAAYLVTTQTPGMSAVQFQRQLGLKRYETAFQILHKLRAGLIRPERDAIGEQYPVEVDETFVGSRTRGDDGSVSQQITVVGAVEVRSRREDGKSHKRKVYAGRLRLQVVSDVPSMLDRMAYPLSTGRGAESLTRFVTDNVAKGSIVRTDGHVGYRGLTGLGYAHEPMAIRKTPELADMHLPMIHLVFSNLKTWLAGTHHGVSPQHLQAYLNEFTFRFNRRFYPMTSFNSALGLAARTVPPTYEQLYSGEWEHPGLPRVA